MEPLKEWICDECGELIASPKDGWLEWYYEKRPESGRRLAEGFRIVHHASKSPYQGEGSHCYAYKSRPGRADGHLDIFVGPDGLVRLLSMIDFGYYHEKDYLGPRCADLREWVELFRRLHIPYYEEARLYWEAALDGGHFNGANEVSIYLPSSLQELIKEYRGNG